MSTIDSFVGRATELHELGELLDQSGEPVAVFLVGEAGVGKTALLEAAIGASATADTQVLWARATAAEQSSSYAALDDLIRPALGRLTGLPEPQRRALAAALLLEEAAVPVEPRLVGLAVLSLLRSLRVPVRLAVDDWQWLDAASRAVLSFALRRLDPADAKLIATLRSGEADDALGALLHSLPDGYAREYEVGPLDVPTLGRLVHARTGAWLAPPVLKRLHEACSGNALMALEMVRAREARPATDVRRLLGRRIALLSADARAALRFAAALAQPSPEAVEAAMPGPGRGARGIEEALAAEVLVRDGRRLRFSHPLLVSAVEERTPPSEWRSIHARLAELTADPEQRAHHLAAAADGPDAEVATALERAASRATARGATIAAAELAERAAALTPENDGTLRTRRLLAAAQAEMTIGDGQATRAALEAVIEREPTGPSRAIALHRLADIVTDGTAPQLAEAALVEAGADDALLADIHLSLSNIALFGGSSGRALAHGDAAVRHAETSGEKLLFARALSQLAFVRFSHGEGLQREALLRADSLEREADGLPDRTALEVLGMQLYMSGELAEARELLTAERDRARARGQLDHESSTELLLAEVELRAGRWRPAEDHARRNFEMMRGAELWNAEPAARWACAAVDAHRGRVSSARDHAEAGRQRALEMGDLAFATRCAHVLGFLALSLGDAKEAARHLRCVRDDMAKLGNREPGMFCTDPDVAEALLGTGDIEGARKVQAWLEKRGRALGRTWSIATAMRCRGLIAAAEGRTVDAVADLEAALAAHDAVPQPFDRARTLLALGTAQRRAKRRAEARTSLDTALAIFEELGAALWVQRARAEMARLGGRRAQDRDELTPTERRIAEEVAAGRSNREVAATLFVAERTVEANLTRIYRKLGVRSRSQLARVLR